MTLEESIWWSFGFALTAIAVLSAAGVGIIVWYKLGDRDDQPTKR